MGPNCCNCFATDREPWDEDICIYCSEIINPDNTSDHKNCKDFYDFILEDMIDKMKYRLELLLDKKLQVYKKSLPQ